MRWQFNFNKQNLINPEKVSRKNWLKKKLTEKKIEEKKIEEKKIKKKNTENRQ